MILLTKNVNKTVNKPEESNLEMVNIYVTINIEKKILDVFKFDFDIKKRTFSNN